MFPKVFWLKISDLLDFSKEVASSENLKSLYFMHKSNAAPTLN